MKLDKSPEGSEGVVIHIKDNQTPIKLRYKPSTSEEANMFMDVFCSECRHKYSCYLLNKAIMYEINDPDFPEEFQMQGDTGVCIGYQNIKIDSHEYLTNYHGGIFKLR